MPKASKAKSRKAKRTKRVVKKRAAKRRAVRRPSRKARPVRSTTRSKGGKNILLQQLEKLLGTFSDDMITSLDLKDEKKNLLKKINELKREEIHLQDMVEDLEAARDKQATEMEKKEREEEDLKNRVTILKDEKAGMESEKITLNQQIDALKREKEDLNASLERTNDLLIRFRAHIEEFDDELKSD